MIVWHDVQSLAGHFAGRVLVLVVVAAEAAEPVLVADIVRIEAPVGFALGEDRGGEESLHASRCAGQLVGGCIGVFRADERVDLLPARRRRS